MPSADSLATSHDQSHTFMCSVVEKSGFGAIWTDLGHFGRISALKVTPKWHILGHSGEVKVDALPYTLSYGHET